MAEFEAVIGTADPDNMLENPDVARLSLFVQQKLRIDHGITDAIVTGVKVVGAVLIVGFVTAFAVASLPATAPLWLGFAVWGAGLLGGTGWAISIINKDTKKEIVREQQDVADAFQAITDAENAGDITPAEAQTLRDQIQMQIDDNKISANKSTSLNNLIDYLITQGIKLISNLFLIVGVILVAGFVIRQIK